MTQDQHEKREALRRGEELLTGNCVGHTYLWFYRDAIETSLRATQWGDALQYATALAAFTKGLNAAVKLIGEVPNRA